MQRCIGKDFWIFSGVIVEVGSYYSVSLHLLSMPISTRGTTLRLRPLHNEEDDTNQGIIVAHNRW